MGPSATVLESCDTLEETAQMPERQSSVLYASESIPTMPELNARAREILDVLNGLFDQGAAGSAPLSPT